RLGLDIQFTERNPEEALTTFSQALPVVHVDGLVPDQPGKTSPLSGGVVIAAIEQATAATLSGYCRALVTAPIHKGALYLAGFTHPGHTEFLAELCRQGATPKLPVMMLAH